MYKYVVSACLAGYFCRYDGKSSPCKYVLELMTEGKAFPLCPEMLGGLPTPRFPAEIYAGKILTAQGKDVSTFFYEGAQKALLLAQKLGCNAAILKTRSPSCARDEIYDGTFSKILIKGQGIWAKSLQEAGFKLYTEEDLPSKKR